MENSLVNIQVDHLPLAYRANFVASLFNYVYAVPLQKLQKDFDALIAMNASVAIIYRGNKYISSDCFLKFPKADILNSKYEHIANELISKKDSLFESTQLFKSSAANAVALCKSVADIKLLFTEDLFNKCWTVNHDNYLEPQPLLLTSEAIELFTKENPTFIESIKEQLITNLLIY